MEVTMQPVRKMSTLLAEIIRRVRAADDPDQIILFGSYARGDFDSDSDLDLLVIKGHGSILGKVRLTLSTPA
jgi:predicted nucleotidyltransferase